MIAENKYIPLDRAVIKISGEDSAKLLQGMLSNDINKVSEGAIYTYLLTPQGKYLYDFFVSEKDGYYLIDISSVYKDEFLKKLKMYKLRSKADIEDLSQSLEVASLTGSKVFEKMGDAAALGSVHEFCKGHAYLDPRSRGMYARAIISRDNQYQAFHAQEFNLDKIEAYHRLRIENNIPEGEFDLIQDKSFPLQYRMIELNGVDFKKGCYVGQEVTARTHHRGVVRKTTFVLEAESEISANRDDEIIMQDKKVGEFLSCSGNKCLALLDIEFAKDNKSFEFQGVKYKILP